MAIAKDFRFDKKTGEKDLREFTLSPHPFGSLRQKDLGDYILLQLRSLGIDQAKHDFMSEVPNREYTPDTMRPITLSKNGANILALISIAAEAPCLILLGSHYDTKELPGVRYLGANDSASSSILLLQIAAFLHSKKSQLAANLRCNLGFVWFDGEEAILENWDDGRHKHPAHITDNTYGSRALAELLQPCPDSRTQSGLCIDHPLLKNAGSLSALILIDMVGSPDVSLTRDSNSSPALLELLKKGNEAFGRLIPLSDTTQNIKDDHIAFCQAQVPCINLIDFQHLMHWHQSSDTPENISFKSLEKIGKLAVFMTLTTRP